MSTRLLVLFATVCWGVWGFALKRAVLHIPPLAAYIAFASANLAMIPVYAAIAHNQGLPLRFTGSGVSWAVTASVCVGTGTVATLFALQGNEGSRVIALTSTYPAVTLLLSVLLMGESVTPTKLVGVGAIALGAYLLAQ